LQSKVSTGFYNNATEVVRDAIRRMCSEDEKLETLRTSAIQFGEEPRERGEEVPHAAEERLETITTKALNTARKGKQGKA
jgi:antitoxin ParD1/3/4